MQFLLHSFTFFQCTSCWCRNRLIEVSGDYRPPFFNYLQPLYNFVNVSETGFLVHRAEKATCGEFCAANENLCIGYGHFPFVVHWQIVFITSTSLGAGRWTWSTSIIFTFIVELLTEKDFHSALAHVVMAIECFTGFLVHFVHHLARVFIEQINEALEDVQMEGRCNEFAMLAPFVTWRINWFVLLW